MIDMYPRGPVSAAVYEGNGTRPPWEVAPLFDGTGYTLIADQQSWKMEGGVRNRVFASTAQLMKYPLIRWGPVTNLNKSIHVPSPYWRNYAPVMGALLHFKFFSDYWDAFQATVVNAQHYRDGGLYADMLRQISHPDDLVLEDDVSAIFVGPDDLARRGFFDDWNADKRTSH
jgi:hypothetical protein